MARIPLKLQEISTFIHLPAVKVGKILSLSWSTRTAPTAVFVWRCRIVAKFAGEDPPYILFTSDDAAEPDREEEWVLPKFVSHESDEEDEETPEDDSHLEFHYYSIELVSREKAQGKSMAASAARALSSSGIVAWQPATWKAKLETDRYQVVSEVFKQLEIPERLNQAKFKSADDHEACALGEIWLGVVDLLAVCDNKVRDCPQSDALMSRILLRLSQIRAGRGKEGKERAKVMDAVLAAWLRTETPNDAITHAILGISRGNSGSTKGS